MRHLGTRLRIGRQAVEVRAARLAKRRYENGSGSTAFGILISGGP